MQHKVVPECEILNLPENYEQFVEGLHRTTPYVEPHFDSRSDQTSPKTGRKKQIKVSCLVDRNQRSSSLVNVSKTMLRALSLSYFSKLFRFL